MVMLVLAVPALVELLAISAFPRHYFLFVGLVASLLSSAAVTLTFRFLFRRFQAPVTATASSLRSESTTLTS